MADIFARTRVIEGTTAEWLLNNLLLGDGELAVERHADGPRLHVGDGATPALSAPFIGQSSLIQISAHRVASMNALVNGSWPGVNDIAVISFHPNWTNARGPLGRSNWVHDGTTGGVQTTATTVGIQTAMRTGKVISADGKGWRLSRDQPITDLMFGAVADDDTDDTNAINSAIVFVRNNHNGPNPLVHLPAVGPRRVTTIIMYGHTGLMGERPMGAHSIVAPQLAYASEIRQISGTNSDIIRFDLSEVGNSSLEDVVLKYLTIRGAWTGPGDAVNTTGHAINCQDNYFIQGCDISYLNILYTQGSCIYGTVIPLPGIFVDIWGKMVNGSVLHFNCTTARITHMFYADRIQGDFTIGPVINIDGSGVTSAGGAWAACTFLFSNLKHEIDSGAPGAGATTTYSPDTIVLTNLDRAAVTLINVDAMPSNPLGGGIPVTNALLRLEGTTRPHVEWIGCRMGSSNAVNDLVIDDNVSGSTDTVHKDFRSGSHWGKRSISEGANNNADIIYRSRQITNANVADAYARYERAASGKQFWGPGNAATDVALWRVAADTLGLDAGDSFRVPRCAAAAASQVTSTLQLVGANGGVYNLWVDSAGKLRIANTKPADCDTGGTVVGTQT